MKDELLSQMAFEAYRDSYYAYFEKQRREKWADLPPREKEAWLNVVDVLFEGAIKSLLGITNKTKEKVNDKYECS